MNAKLDKNGKTVAIGSYNLQVIPLLCDDDGNLILDSATKNSSYTLTEERAQLDNNGNPIAIAINPLGAIRKLKVSSEGKLKFVQK